MKEKPVLGEVRWRNKAWLLFLINFHNNLYSQAANNNNNICVNLQAHCEMIVIAILSCVQKLMNLPRVAVCVNRILFIARKGEINLGSRQVELKFMRKFTEIHRVDAKKFNFMTMRVPMKQNFYCLFLKSSAASESFFPGN